MWSRWIRVGTGRWWWWTPMTGASSRASSICRASTATHSNAPTLVRVRSAAGGWSRSIAERRMLHNLADKMSEHTGVHTEVLDGVALDDPRLMQVPFLLLTVRGRSLLHPSRS